MVSTEYLAGFIDAEGCLMIAEWKGKRSWNPQYRMRMSLSNTYRPVLEDVQREFGGILVDDPRSEAGWKQAYQLVWTNGMVERLLLPLRLHLRVKQAQAEVLVAFIRHHRGTRQGRQGGKGRFFAHLPDHVIAYREGIRKQIRELNTKGPPSLTRART